MFERKIAKALRAGNTVDALFWLSEHEVDPLWKDHDERYLLEVAVHARRPEAVAALLRRRIGPPWLFEPSAVDHRAWSNGWRWDVGWPPTMLPSEQAWVFCSRTGLQIPWLYPDYDGEGPEAWRDFRLPRSGKRAWRFFRCPLWNLIRHGRQLSVCKVYWEERVLPKFIHAGFHTALHRAVDESDISLVRFLLDTGEPVKRRDAGKHTPLFVACFHNNMEIARLLVEYGAGVRGRNIIYHTPLHYVARWGGTSMGEWLLGQGASPHARDRHGKTPLHHAASAGNHDMLTMLMAHTSDLEILDRNGMTPLHTAARYGQTLTLSTLARAGAKIKTQTPAGKTPVRAAAYFSHPETLQALLELGAGTELPAWEREEIQLKTGDGACRYDGDAQTRTEKCRKLLRQAWGG